MGVVYAAYDHEHRCEVALKLLPSVGPAAAERIKSEFRVAAGLHHPNLVSLAELIEHDEHLFFTMELVSGVDWLSYVRGQRPGAHGDRQRGTQHDAETASLSGGDVPVTAARAACLLETARPPVDGARLRAALQQLALALTHLHSEDKVHRDIKPSNVLVTEEGRVVLLDFGLAVDLSRERRSVRAADGTALYMSPEQARGDAPTPASDWYSVGTLLYEAITGRVPFVGTRAQVLAAKQEREPELPRDLVPGAPEELRALCRALLARVPEQRARSEDVLAVVARAHSAPLATERPVTAPVVGRDEELRVMLRAFDDAVEGPVALLIEGESGVGKTTLIGEFRRKLEARDPRTTIFCDGRCSERESVAFKALDRIVEVLAERYASIFAPGACDGEEAQAAAVAVQAAALAFPVLGRARGAALCEPRSGSDAWQQQRVAFQGLRELLVLVARRRRLVLCIDDWQWVDADSIGLLSHLLAAPAPPLLLVLATRPGTRAPGLACPERRLVLGNLAPESAEQLAERLLNEHARSAPSWLVRAIATESLGHPLFIGALARQVAAGGDRAPGRPDLDAAIGSRVDELPPLARAAAELLAVFQGPLVTAVLESALASNGAGPRWPELAHALARLTVENLARADGVRANDTVDCFHSRVAAAILARIPAARRREHHRALARALELHHSQDFESMTDHWAEACDRVRAAAYALRAAERAEESLAFERAARLYRRSLDLCPTQSGRVNVETRLAAALGHAGRGRDAADAYLSAASVAAPEQRLELQRHAADQLFRSGYVGDALRLSEQVLPSHGLLLPRSPREALARLALRRLAIRARGLRFKRRAAASIPPAELARIDAAWTVAVGLSTVDNLRAAAVQSGCLLMALRVGEPFRVVRALAAEAPYIGTEGVATRARVDRLLALAQGLAAELSDPYALGFVHLARCFACYMRSDFAAARAAGDEAEAVFESRPVMAFWELTSARMLSIGSHFYDGDLRVIRRRIPGLIGDAERRGDVYAATCLRLGACNLAWVVGDESAEARRQLRAANDSWSYDGVHLQQCWSLSAWVHVDLYDGDVEQAYARVRRAWHAIEHSFIMRFERLRAELFWLRARAALGCAEQRPGLGGSALADAEHWGARLLGESAPWAPSAGHLVLAGVHALRGSSLSARESLRRAVSLAATSGIQIIARTHAQWLGDEAHGLAEEVARPERWVRMLAPGLTRLRPSPV
jgi:hypothetical protein